MKLIDKPLGRCLWEQARINGQRPAMEMGDWSCTFKELDRVSDLLAGRMKRYNIEKGTHVGIWSVNSPNWIFTFLALVKVGAVPVLINTCYKQEEMKGLLNYSDVEVLYYGNGYKTILYDDVIASIQKNTPKVRHFIPIGEKEEGNWMREGDFSPEERSDRALEETKGKKDLVSSSDPLCMIFTSGSTSLPKGVVLTHYNVVNNSRTMIECLGWTKEDKMCITVPLFHCFGITAGIVSCIQSGMCMHLIPYFKTGKVWDGINTYGCTVLNGVPSMFLALIRKTEYKDRKADGLKSGIIAGSPVTSEEYREICGRFVNMHLLTSYGQTETSPCVTMADWEGIHDEKVISAGKVTKHVQARIWDLDGSQEAKEGEPGEIQVKGYNVMSGYYNLPLANEKAFTRDGWLKTGDIGWFDKKMELHITGRIKEMIIRAGENISPQEIEQAIRGLKWVEQVKVVGVPAEVLQEEIAACIILAEGCRVCEEELLRYLQPKLAHYKIPSYVLTFDEFPMNASGKINLKVVREMAAQRVERIRRERQAREILRNR